MVRRLDDVKITIWLLFVMFFGTLNQEQGWTSLIPGQHCVPLEVDYYRVLEQRKGDYGFACEEELWETALTCKQSTKHSPSARQRHIPMGFGPVPYCLQDKALTEHSHVVSQRSLKVRLRLGSLSVVLGVDTMHNWALDLLLTCDIWLMFASTRAQSKLETIS